MKFEHVLAMSVEGSTMFGLSLDILHSEVINIDGLRLWVDTLANSFSFMDDTLGDNSVFTFRDGFLYELQAYCLYIASSDGSISEDILENINQLIGSFHIDLDEAIGILKEINSDGWLRNYPASFKTLVWFAAGKEKSINSAGEIYYFYRQVARFIYSIEHAGNFDKEGGARKYVAAFKKYVERVSAIDFEMPPENESTINDVCKEWDLLMKEERGELFKRACGTWRGVSGDALSSGVLSDFVLDANGVGSMGMSLIHWEIAYLELSGIQAPVLRIPEMHVVVILFPTDTDKMLAMAYSGDSNMDLKTAIYQLEQPDGKRGWSAPAASARNVPSQTSRAVTVKESKSKTGVPWQVIAVAIAALAFVVYSIAMKPVRAYEQATLHFEAGQYQLAANAFEELGDYEDSEAMEQKALLGVAAQEAMEKAGEDPDAWESAAQAFDQLGEGQGESEARTCRNYAAYYEGKRRMEEGKWKKAKNAFKSITSKSFEDVKNLRAECDTHIAYDEAEALFEEGKYYQAYVKFSALEGSSVESLPDLSERADACIQDFPGTGASYTNPNYYSSAVPLTINNHSGNTFYTIYDGDTDTLAMTVCIQPGESASISLPAGSYRMNEAHGERWFGEEEMFGDDGNYYHCIFGGEDTADLEWGYSYEISTSYGYNFDGTGIRSEAIDRDSF